MLGDASEAGKSEDDFIPELETVYSKVTPPLPSVHLFADRSIYLRIGPFICKSVHLPMLGAASEAGKSEEELIPVLETVFSRNTPPLSGQISVSTYLHIGPFICSSVHSFADRSVYVQIGP